MEQPLDPMKHPVELQNEEAEGLRRRMQGRSPRLDSRMMMEVAPESVRPNEGSLEKFKADLLKICNTDFSGKLPLNPSGLDRILNGGLRAGELCTFFGNAPLFGDRPKTAFWPHYALKMMRERALEIVNPIGDHHDHHIPPLVIVDSYHPELADEKPWLFGFDPGTPKGDQTGSVTFYVKKKQESQGGYVYGRFNEEWMPPIDTSFLDPVQEYMGDARKQIKDWEKGYNTSLKKEMLKRQYHPKKKELPPSKLLSGLMSHAGITKKEEFRSSLFPDLKIE